ncbi:hypothetical protein [Vreelandella olivaria]|nr:hypothetical protein [Halomonas olivaria]
MSEAMLASLQVALPTPSDRFLVITEAVAAIDNNNQNININDRTLQK